MLTEGTPIRVCTIYGGMSEQKQLRIIKKQKPHIIVGTPGRLSSFLELGLLDFDYLKFLVIDEADRMVEMGHFQEMDAILGKIFHPKLQETFDKSYT